MPADWKGIAKFGLVFGGIYAISQLKSGNWKLTTPTTLHQEPFPDSQDLYYPNWGATEYLSTQPQVGWPANVSHGPTHPYSQQGDPQITVPGYLASVGTESDRSQAEMPQLFEGLIEALEQAGTRPWQPPSDQQLVTIVRHPSVVLIIGRRDSGKSVLGYRLLELLRGHGTPYVVGLPANAVKLLPDWIGVMERLEDVPNGSVVLVDEAYLSLHARTGMSEAGRSIGNDINLGNYPVTSSK